MLGEVLVVRDDDQGDLPLVESIEEFEDGVARCRVEISSWLVREDDLRFRNQGSSDRNPLLLSAGEFLRAVREAILESDHLEAANRLFAALGPWDALVEERDRDVLDDVQLADQVECLEDEADLAAPDLAEGVVVEVGEVTAPEVVRAFGGGIQAAEQVHQRGLPGSRGTHDRKEVAFGDVQVHATECLHQFRAIRLVVDLPDPT